MQLFENKENDLDVIVAQAEMKREQVRRAIDQGIEDAENGDVITTDEARNRLRTLANV